MVYRCLSCSAPLSIPEDRYEVECPYCLSQNNLISKTTQKLLNELEEKTKRAEKIAEETELKTKVVQKKLELAVLADDKENALKYYEGLLRLEMAEAQIWMTEEQLQENDKKIKQNIIDYSKSL